MTEVIQPKFVFVWKVTYTPERVLPFYIPPINYYFNSKDKFDKFIQDNDNLRCYMKTSKTLAAVHENVFYPFPEQYVFDDTII